MYTENYDLPLYDLFKKLRDTGFPLGIGEYKLLIKALQGGFGLARFDADANRQEHKKALKYLCELLWTNSQEEKNILNKYFEQMFIITDNGTKDNARDNTRNYNNEHESNTEENINTARINSAFIRNNHVHGSSQYNEEKIISMVKTKYKEKELFENTFIDSDEFFPITRRQMKQSWRYLRQMVREGSLMEIDLEATVRSISIQGMLLEPTLALRRINRSELLLLIDRDGSMTPFHILSERLIDTASRGGRLGKAGVRYFHNCPVDYVYQDLGCQSPESLDSFLFNIDPQRTLIMFFSDAGAARGHYNEKRFDLTEKLISQLKTRTRHIVWLNPMPSSRWPGSTAREIALNVPMFEFTRKGFLQAIRVLRGRPLHS